MFQEQNRHSPCPYDHPGQQMFSKKGQIIVNLFSFVDLMVSPNSAVVMQKKSYSIHTHMLMGVSNKTLFINTKQWGGFAHRLRLPVMIVVHFTMASSQCYQKTVTPTPENGSTRFLKKTQ